LCTATVELRRKKSQERPAATFDGFEDR